MESNVIISVLMILVLLRIRQLNKSHDYESSRESDHSIQIEDTRDHDTLAETEVVSSRTESYKKHYHKKTYLMTSSEASFFHLLNLIYAKDYFVMSQINLDKLIDVNSWYVKNHTYKNRIDKKSVDYVLIDKQSLKPRLALELDGPDHFKPDRRVRDQFVNKLFQDLELPLLRVCSQDSYSANDLKNRIDSLLC